MIVYTDEEFAKLPVGTKMKGHGLSRNVFRFEDGWGWEDAKGSWYSEGSGLIVGGSGWTVLNPELATPLWEM